MEISIPDADQLSSVFLRTFLIFTFTFISFRLLGKKRISQFSIFDLLLVVSLGSAVGDAMIYPEKTVPILISTFAIMVVVLLIKIYDGIVDKIPRIQSVMEGSPTVLIRNGKIQEDELHNEKMTKEELLSQLREKGYEDVEKIKKAILELDGRLSVIGEDEKENNLKN